MMYPRLKLARNLLSEDGLLFVSIDDNEANNLKRICDEIFGERNYLNQMAWVVNITGRQISGNGAAKTWESVFVYAKNAELAQSLEVDISFAKKEMPGAYKGFEKDIRTDAHGEFAVGDTLYNHNRKFNEETRRNLVYSIFYNPKTEEIVPGDIGEKKDGFVEILPHENGDGIHKYHAWRWSRQKVIDESYDLIALPTSNGGWELHTRIRDFSTTTLKDLITNISNGDAEVQKLFDGKKYFDYPKSVALMSLLINSVKWGEHATILDFFSGSGTTGHAVLATNAKKKRNYKFILVQLPQECDKKSAAYKAGFSNICEIAKERIRRASKQIAEENATTAPDLDMGFRVLKLDSSSLEDTAQTVSEINQLALKYSRLKTDRSADDLLFQVLLETRLPLSEPISKSEVAGNEVFFVGGTGEGAPLVACLDPKAKMTTEFFLEIAKLKPGLAFFRDDAFADDSARTNLQQAFDQFSPSTSIKVI